MRITFLAGHLKINGGNRIILKYADLLARMGHEVTVVALTNGRIRRAFKNIMRLKPNWTPGLAAKVAWIADYKENNIPDGDTVVATAWQMAGPVASYSARKGKKFYLSLHYESLFHGPPDLVDPTYRLPLTKIVPSSWLQKIIKDKFQSDSHVIVIPVDLDLFKFLPEYRKPAPIRVMMLHHTHLWKGTKVGLDVFRKVKADFPGIQLVMFGVRDKKFNDPICDEYHYNPKQEDLAKIYSSCHIYVCTSEYEALGMPPMEAMACKCANVTFDTGGSSEYAIDGETAFVAKHSDAGDLEAKLRLAVSNQKLREEISQRGYDFIRANFSWDDAAQKIAEIFSND